MNLIFIYLCFFVDVWHNGGGERLRLWRRLARSLTF